MVALKLLPITMVSTFKASRPMFVVLFSLLLFGERLSLLQWLGVGIILTALYLLGLSGEREGISFTRNKGVLALFGSILTGVVSALFDKHILSGLGMQPLFVQGWTNVYIAVLLALVILAMALASGSEGKAELTHFRPDWCILLAAVLITAADMLYFFALKQDGAMLSVVSLLRRSSTIVTFALGAAVFKEHRIWEKTTILAILLTGVVLLAISSS